MEVEKGRKRNGVKSGREREREGEEWSRARGRGREWGEFSEVAKLRDQTSWANINRPMFTFL